MSAILPLRREVEAFVPAPALRNPHLQTVYAACLKPAPTPKLRRERFTLPDGDQLTLAWGRDSGGPIVLVLHGLTGSADSAYIRRLIAALERGGFTAVAVEARGIDGLNLAPGFQHAGDPSDLEAIGDSLVRRYPGRELAAVGYSIGGNLLLNWLAAGSAPVAAACAVSVPFDLAACTAALDQGLARIYQTNLLRGLKRMMRRKLVGSAAGFMSAAELAAIASLRQFDERITAPLHGFADAQDYYRRSSCGQRLAAIDRPTLLVHAEDDPFVPAKSIPCAAALPRNLELRLSAHGGHLGFVAHRCTDWLEQELVGFLATALRLV